MRFKKEVPCIRVLLQLYIEPFLIIKMYEKQLPSRIIAKHDTTVNWSKATTFIPKLGELIVYTDKYFDGVKSYPAMKVGDGVHTIGSLPFMDEFFSTTLLYHLDDELVHLRSGERARWNSNVTCLVEPITEEHPDGFRLLFTNYNDEENLQ